MAAEYYRWAESILEAMIDSTLKGNRPVVFVLNRPFLEACYKGTRICVADPKKLGHQDANASLDTIARQIDEVIDQRFKDWDAPFKTTAVRSRYSAFLKGAVLKNLSDAGKIKPSSMIARLHNDTHGGLPSIEFYRDVENAGLLAHSTKELCVIGHDPFLMNFRFALSKAFPDGPINSSNLMAEPLVSKILQVYKLPD